MKIRQPNKNVSHFLWANILVVSTLFGQAGALGQIDESPLNSNFIVHYSIGHHFLLPSLIANSDLRYDDQKLYSDVWFTLKTQITERISYMGSLELTTLPHELIGTKYSREDYFLSTGRFQESQFFYRSKSLSILLGRANFFDERYRSDVFVPPVNGDGFSWKYTKKKWVFKHVIESLPAAKSGETVFRRLLNYHHLAWKMGGFELGAGEYFLLTGPSIGLDLKRLNPFIPYARNSHDSYADTYAGFSGDSDNALIKLFFEWRGARSIINTNLYIDEFQIDPKDREQNSDALLLNVMGQYNFESILSINLPGSFEFALSLANPNFGDHPGPFTSATSMSYPLFETSSGMQNLVYLKSDLYPNSNNSISVSYSRESWVDISSLSPELRNQKAFTQILEVQKDSQISVGYNHVLKALPLSIMLQGWGTTSDTRNTWGSKLSLVYNYSF